MRKKLLFLLFLAAIAAVAFFVGFIINKQNTESVSGILEEPLVQQAINQLPELENLEISAAVITSDSTEIVVLYFDRKTENASLLFSSRSGEETLVITKGYPEGKTLELYFSYKNEILSVDGSKIYSSSDTTHLNEKDVYEITKNKYKREKDKEDDINLIRT